MRCILGPIGVVPHAVDRHPRVGEQRMADARIHGGHQDWGPGHAAPGAGIGPRRPYRRGVGEHMQIRVLRALGVAALAVASVTALSSCSQPGAAPGAVASSQAGEIVDPSVPISTPTETVASDTPAPVVTESAPIASTPPADSRAAVVPAITTKDWDASAKALDVSAIVPGIVESGGTCTATVSSGSTTRTATSVGVGAGSYTGCPAVEFKDLAAGSWKVVVRYASTKSAGPSAPATVQIG